VTWLLGIVCFVLLMFWLDERRMSNFWQEQWRRESQFALRLLDGDRPRLRVIRGGKS